MITKKTIRARWREMKYRCYNETNPGYVDYGRRGITVCPEWLIFDNYYEWYQQNYIEGCTVDRVNNDGNYSSDNCKFSTQKEQINNRRPHSTNRRLGIEVLRTRSKDGYYSKRIEFNGQLYFERELEEMLGFKKGTIYNRKRLGWDMNKILTEPIMQGRNN